MLEKYDYKFSNMNFQMVVMKNINRIFAKLNHSDIKILTLLTSYLIEDIMVRYNMIDMNAYTQLTQNNGRDIISLCLTLLPFIKEGISGDITSLSNILYLSNDSNNNINTDILDISIKDAIKENFPYSNFSLGLLNKNEKNLLDLSYDNISLIYHIIHTNFISMLETIKITNGKLFINWLNTVPMVDYNKTELYKLSMKEIKGIIDSREDDNIVETLNNNKGLWLGDYYNVLTNGYYYSIKSIKWVIFPKRINTGKYYYSLQYLNEIFDLSNIFQYNEYNNMNESGMNEFNNIIKRLANNIKNHIATAHDIKFEKDLLKNMFIFMVNNYSKINLIDRNILQPFILDNNNSRNDLDKDENIIEKKNITDMELNNILTFLSNEPQYMWNYIKETIVILKSTIYYNYLIKDNKVIMDKFNVVDNINLKNIYNIAKILCHSSDSDFTPLSTNFKGLTEMQKVTFFKRYRKIGKWYRVSNNIRMQENGTYNEKDIMNGIKKGWDEIKINIIWEYMRYNGLLTSFKCNIIQNNMKIKEALKIYFDMNPRIFDENYFMTNDSYNNLTIYDKTKNIKDTISADTISYKNLLVRNAEIKHFTFYANDWISQLSFFNHYINHSIMFVTGSTGTGKSTQIPKLALYCLKMYDYRMDGRIVCTEPRIPPTQENAKRIASEMGLDIVVNINDKDKKIEMKRDQYYLQFKHNKDKHTKEKCSHLTLRMVTDGTLLEELVKNPLLKEKKKGKKTNIDDNYIFTLKNYYDVVIVDEAHEHNMNMDMILTLMRQTLQYNNSTKLIIVSATMDMDEPIYRYYYKTINSNIMYPIKQAIVHPFLKDTFFHINSFYMDRRIDISIPGETTLEQVDEIYDEIIENDFTYNMKDNYMKAQEKSYKVVNDICNKNRTGDILLFSVGKKEIVDIVIHLNNILPPDTIALPYYSEMHSIYRTIVSNIHNSVNTIRYKRSNIGIMWGEEYIEDNSVSMGTYKRAVIVATNVAEASITIPSLKFVVDTGYSKVNRYNDMSDTSTISIEMITESSRVQRKGRVGRVSNGMVYYIYGKGKRQDVIPKYGITLNDFHSTFLKLASKNIDNMNYLWEDMLSPYLFESSNYTEMKMDLNNSHFRSTNIYRYNIYNIIKSQYYLNNEIISNNRSYYYPFNEYMMDTTINRKPDGYDAKILFDMTGLYYIIHPFEDRLTRNIMGNIIKYNNMKKTKDITMIEIVDIQPLINNMRVKMLYLDINHIYKKTVYSDKINEMIQVMENNMTEKESNILLLGSCYKITVETCQVLSMIKTTSSISVLARKNGKYIDIDNLKKLFGSDSDITSLYNICSKLKDNLYDMEIYLIMEQYKKSSNMSSSPYKDTYDRMVQYYRMKQYHNLSSNITERIKLMNHFNWLENNGMMMTTDEGMNGFILWLTQSNFLKNKIMMDINKNKNRIETICSTYYLNTNIILEYFNVLTRNILCIIASNKEVDRDFNEVGVFDWCEGLYSNFMKNLKINTIEHKLNICFFLGQPLIAIRKEDNYISMRDGRTLGISMIFNKMNTFCTNLSSYLYYFSLNKDMMQIIYNIDPYYLPHYYPLHYNKNNINTRYNVMKDNRIERLDMMNSENLKLVEIVRNNYNMSNFMFNSPHLPVIMEYIKSM